MCLSTKPCEEPTSAGVWWRDDADWKQYNAAQAAAIQRGIADGVSRVDLGNVVSLKHAGGVRYVVDLSTMKQTNLASGYIRDVKVVKVPATAVAAPVTASDDNLSMMEELRACRKSIRSLKKMVLKLEADLLAVRLEVLDSKAKRVAANFASTNEAAVDLKRPWTHGLSGDAVCESCDSGAEYWSEYLLEDDY